MYPLTSELERYLYIYYKSNRRSSYKVAIPTWGTTLAKYIVGIDGIAL